MEQDKHEGMSILLRGGAGDIGRHARVACKENGYHVIVVDTLSDSRTTSLLRALKITGEKVEYYLGDLRNENFIAETRRGRNENPSGHGSVE